MCTTDLDALLVHLTAAGLPPLTQRFEIPAAGLTVCIVGDTLVIAADETSIEPYRATAVTFVVDDVREHVRRLTDRGATVVRGIGDTPTGWNATLRVDDVQLELVEWSDEQWDTYRKLSPAT